MTLIKAEAKTGAELLDGLQAMVPDLRARGRDAEEAGRIPEETIQELAALGAFKAVVPKMYGGMEIDYPVIPQIFRILGRGCTSTAWCMGFLIYHNFQFAHFPKEAQDEVWGGRGYTMAPGQVIPSGNAIAVDGGYKLTGRWGYATGIQHGDWMLLAAPVEGRTDQPDIRRFYVPVSDCTILDTWHVSAMRATGSRDVEIDGAFVPEHRSISQDSLRSGTAPGLAFHTGPLWRMPLLTYMVFGAVGPLIGAAEAMYELVADILKTKVGAYSGDRQQGLMTQRVRMGRLRMELDAAIGLFENRIDFVWDRITGGGTLTLEERAEMRMVVSHIAKKCHEIVDELALAAGSRGTFIDSPIQRFHRDVNSLATHAIFEYDHVASLFGGLALAIDLPPGSML